MKLLTNLKDKIGGWITQKWLGGVIRSIFEKVPLLSRIFSLANGHKEKIGRALLAVGVALESLVTLFPEYDTIGDVNSYFLIVAGWFFTEFGLQHAKDKWNRELNRDGTPK